MTALAFVCFQTAACLQIITRFMPSVSPTPRVKLRATSRRVPRARSTSAANTTDADSEPNMRLSRAIVVMLLLHVVAVGGIFAFSFIKERDAGRSPANQTNPTAGAVEAEESALSSKSGVGISLHVKTGPAATPARPTVHVVRVGETLTRIANDHGVTLEALVAVNGASTVTNGLHPGQELKLPSRSPEPEPPLVDDTTNALGLIEGRPPSGTGDVPGGTSTAKPPHLPPDSGKVYVVGKGESLYAIAQKLRVSYDALLKLNQIDDPKKLKSGQKLHIPAPSKMHGM